jgi:hypothetical protein
MKMMSPVMFVLTLALIPAFSPGEKVNPAPLF